MTQLLLTEAKRHKGRSIHCWAPDGYQVGQQVRWNGVPWRVAAIYGTHLSVGEFAQKREKPRDEEES